jgi:Skp family chaperone for outer membrane proteins
MMKQINSNMKMALVALVLAMAAWHIPSTPGHAQDAPAFKVGILDFEYIFRKSKAGSALIATVKANQKKLDEEASATGKKLRDQQAQIQKDCQKLAAEECKAKQDKFLTDMKAAEDSMNDKRKALEKRMIDGKDKITKALGPIVEKIIADKKLTLVIDRAAVMYRDQSYDITQEALQGLDAKLASL